MAKISYHILGLFYIHCSSSCISIDVLRYQALFILQCITFGKAIMRICNGRQKTLCLEKMMFKSVDFVIYLSFYLFGIKAAVPFCPDGWISNQTSCYFFSTDTLNWDEAFEQCIALQSYLVEIDDSDENDFLVSVILGTSDDKYYIGLSDREIEGIWKWMTSGNVLGFSSWISGQPDNSGGNENCALFSNSLWNDASCTSLLRRYICEKRYCNALSVTNANLNDSTTSYGTVVEITCLEGYTINGSTTVECLADGVWSDSPT
ncbi:perlucin-like protein [Mercenaria mercenaria]|uniref:perlucin-like protein n=1 Tax=Mercenaria mercenaria TaxID=6596 RepID=UPI00234E6FFC|nr:perlucin-like protein [Mercenaria mercenaria]